MNENDSPTARRALTEALRQTALALRELDGALPVNKLRTLRELRAAGVGYVTTIRQPGVGEPVHLLLEAVDNRGRRTPLLRVPELPDEEDD